MDRELQRHAEALFGARPARPDADLSAAPDPAVPTDESSNDAVVVPATPGLDLTRQQLGRLWRHVASIDNFWESLQEIEPGAVARLAAVAADRRWELLFLTKRPPSEGAPPQVQSQRWLDAHGFRLPSVYVVRGSRGRIAAALSLDVVVDDRPENCMDVVADSPARAVLVWRHGASTIPEATSRLGIAVVRSVGECLDVLTDAPREEKESFLDRIMRKLGAKA